MPLGGRREGVPSLSTEPTLGSAAGGGAERQSMFPGERDLTRHWSHLEAIQARTQRRWGRATPGPRKGRGRTLGQGEEKGRKGSGQF